MRKKFGRMYEIEGNMNLERELEEVEIHRDEAGKLSQITHPKYGDITEDVMKHLAGEDALHEVTSETQAFAAREMERVAQASAALKRDVGRDTGMGRLRMRVTKDVFNFWRRKLGDECWTDKGFLQWFERNFPECRVRYGRKQNVVHYPAGTIFNANGGIANG